MTLAARIKYSAVLYKHLIITRIGYNTVMLWLTIFFYYEILQKNYRKMIFYVPVNNFLRYVMMGLPGFNQ